MQPPQLKIKGIQRLHNKKEERKGQELTFGHSVI
jgi:hypothetical protein